MHRPGAEFAVRCYHLRFITQSANREPLMLQDIPQPYLSILIILFMIWTAAYGVGMLTGKPNALRTRRLPLAGRLIMIGVVVALGAMGWLGWARATLAAPYALWIFLGLVIGASGDLLLGGMFPVQQAEVIALGIFGIGHLCYMAAIAAVRAALGIPAAALLAGAVAGSVTGLAIWLLAIRNPGGSRRMNIGSLVYGSMLFVTAGMGIGAATVSSKMSLLAIGLALFALSDVILAQYMVRRRRFLYIRDVVWIIYSTAQLLIALSSRAVLS